MKTRFPSASSCSAPSRCVAREGGRETSCEVGYEGQEEIDRRALLCRLYQGHQLEAGAVNVLKNVAHEDKWKFNQTCPAIKIPVTPVFNMPKTSITKDRSIPWRTWSTCSASRSCSLASTRWIATPTSNPTDVIANEMKNSDYMYMREYQQWQWPRVRGVRGPLRALTSGSTSRSCATSSLSCGTSWR